MYTIRIWLNEAPTNIIVGNEKDLSIMINHFESQKIPFKVYSVDGLTLNESHFGFGEFYYWIR